MSDEFESFCVGAVAAAVVTAFLPGIKVLGIEAKYAEKVCLINEGVEYIRGDSFRDGKVVCNNGATFYYTITKIRES